MINWQNKAEALWILLDDIDTASDMFKPEQTEFYKYVMKKAEERFKHITSDGYSLYPVHEPMKFNRGGVVVHSPSDD